MSESTLDDFLSRADIAALHSEPGEATGLPAVAYGSGFYELEQRELFPGLWCAVAFASDLPEPGDAKPIELAGWPLLAMRGLDGEVRVFHNVCRHRSNRVIDTPCSGLKRLVCSWHAWSYDLDGRLLATPRIGSEQSDEDSNFDMNDLDLREVASACWLDFVMVNIDGKAAPFHEHIAPLDTLLRSYLFDDVRVGTAWSTDFAGNWKLVVEGGIEDYHLPVIHPELIGEGAGFDPGLDYAEHCHFSMIKSVGEVISHTEALPSLLRDESEQNPQTFVTSVFPTGFITTRLNSLWLWVILPGGGRITHVDTREYFKGEAATDLAYAALRERQREMWELVLEQDAQLVERVQRNMDRPSEAGIRTRFTPYWESNVQRFQQSVVAVLRNV